MKIGIMQPYFFPYIGYWQLMNAVDKYVIYDDVNFIKNGWINRNNILVNKSVHMFTLPLEGASPFEKINQIKITSNEKNKSKMLKTLEMSYKKAPFYNDVFPIAEKTIMEDSCLISVALKNSFEMINKYLDIKTELILSSEMEKDNSLNAQEKVIHICKLLGANTYYNAIGGQELYDKEEFKKNRIELKFLKTKPVEYKQFTNEFIPNLSIIDIMMFNSPEKIREMLNEYELV